jgi:hypothetical protein
MLAAYRESSAAQIAEVALELATQHPGLAYRNLERILTSHSGKPGHDQGVRKTGGSSDRVSERYMGYRRR